MTDEKYTFVEDCREKKRIARGAFNKRTHAGKGGRVRFPSDYKTKRELKAMNGEVHSYKLNKPMKWAEFKGLPEDLKVTYITNLRKSFGVPDVRIADMFGVSGPTVTALCKRLDISLGQGTRSRRWNKEAFEVWCNGESQSVDALQPSISDTSFNSGYEEVTREFKRVVPSHGVLCFDDCTIDQAADMVRKVIGNKKVGLTITWMVEG